jgi:hypothetical protein
MSHGGNTLLSDFIVVAQKLEQLGSTYFNGNVAIVDVGD